VKDKPTTGRQNRQLPRQTVKNESEFNGHKQADWLWREPCATMRTSCVGTANPVIFPDVAGTAMAENSSSNGGDRMGALPGFSIDSFFNPR
jgi:hypothetical protein